MQTRMLRIVLIIVRFSKSASMSASHSPSFAAPRGQLHGVAVGVLIAFLALELMSVTTLDASKLRHDPDCSIEFNPCQDISQVRLQHVGLCLVHLGVSFSPF